MNFIAFYIAKTPTEFLGQAIATAAFVAVFCYIRKACKKSDE